MANGKPNLTHRSFSSTPYNPRQSREQNESQFRLTHRLKELMRAGHLIDTGVVSMALDWEVTQDQLDYALLLLEGGKSHPLPWPRTENSKQFSSEYGPNSSGANHPDDTAGVYLFEDGDDTYVGQAKALAKRVRKHISRGVENTAPMMAGLQGTDGGTVTIYPVRATEEELLALELTRARLLDLLEQILMLQKLPTKNKLLVVRKGGNTGPDDYEENGPSHPDAIPVYCYKLSGPGELATAIYVQTLASIGWLGLMVFGPGNRHYLRNVLERNGLFRGLLYLTTQPLPGVPLINPMTQAQFLAWVKDLAKEPTHSSSQPMVVIDAVTMERSPVYPSKSYIINHVLRKGDKKALLTTRTKPYHGCFFDTPKPGDTWLVLPHSVMKYRK